VRGGSDPRAVSAGRDEQFRAYVEANRGRLLRTATFLAAGDRFAAEDLVQTALMRMYVRWPRIRPETVDAYARKSLANALIDARRRSFVRHERSEAQLPDVVAIDSPVAIDDAVFAALGALPPRMRAAVVLRHLLELSVTETADALHCSEGTVKSQTARGLAQLRSALTPDVLFPSGLPTDPREPVAARHAEDIVRPTYRGST